MEKMSNVFLTREEIEHPYANLAVMLEDKRRKAEQMSRTVFHQITQSEEKLAEKLVYKKIDSFYCTSGGVVRWTSTISDWEYDTKPEAIAATVAKLKEVAE